MKKYAVLSLDVEDWHHINYLSNVSSNNNYSMLDGLNNYLEIVGHHNVKSTLFTLSSIAPIVKNELIYAIKNHHEVASHGIAHKRPLTMSKNEFIEDATKSKKDLEEIIESKVVGYRAPCFSLNNELVKKLIEILDIKKITINDYKTVFYIIHNYKFTDPAINILLSYLE